MGDKGFCWGHEVWTGVSNIILLLATISAARDQEEN